MGAECAVASIEAMEFVQLPTLRVAISAKPVTWATYAAFATESGLWIPEHFGPPSGAVTRVTTAEALAFARWLHRHDGRPYRLPRLEEIGALALAEEAGLDVWPCHAMERASLDRCGAACLTEWLGCLSGPSGERNSLHCVVHPAWLLRRGRERSRGALVDARYSFVTFRIVRKGDS